MVKGEKEDAAFTRLHVSASWTRKPLRAMNAQGR